MSGLCSRKMRCFGALSNGIERPYAEKRALLEVLNVELAQQGEAIQQRRRAYLADSLPAGLCRTMRSFPAGRKH